MEEQGFYTKRRTLSAPLKARSKLSFGEAVPHRIADHEGTSLRL